VLRTSRVGYAALVTPASALAPLNRGPNQVLDLVSVRTSLGPHSGRHLDRTWA
jgi:hypothetical protein